MPNVCVSLVLLLQPRGPTLDPLLCLLVFLSLLPWLLFSFFLSLIHPFIVLFSWSSIPSPIPRHRLSWVPFSQPATHTPLHNFLCCSTFSFSPFKYPCSNALSVTNCIDLFCLDRIYPRCPFKNDKWAGLPTVSKKNLLLLLPLSMNMWSKNTMTDIGRFIHEYQCLWSIASL